MNSMGNEQIFIVDGKKISKDEFQKLQENTNVRLVLQEDGTYKLLKKLMG